MKRGILVLMLCGLAAVSANAQDKIPYKYTYPSQEKIDRQVDSVFRKLSIREKIAQIMIIDFTSDNSDELKAIQKKLVKKEKVGGIIPLGEKSFHGAITRMNQLNKWAKIPMLVTLDAEWGAGMRWEDVPSYQFFIQMGALTSDSLVYEVGKSIAQECRALKIQVNYSPVVDINNNPEKFIVNHRTYGELKEKVAQFSIAMMRGMRDGGVAGSAKHFPGHGDTDVDSHVALPVLPFTAERLDTLELYPFKHLISDGVDMVMVAHLSIPSLDSSGAPSSISKPIVTGLLREKLGYDGIIITDALNMHGVSKHSGLEKKDIPLAAYKAGVDFLLMPENVEESITVIEKALRAGEITMEGLDMRVRKMLALKARLGILDKGYDPIVDTDKLHLFTNLDSKEGMMQEKLNLIKEVSKQTMTVVFNDNSNGFGIPVSFEGKKVAYVGYHNPHLGYEFGVLANRYGQVDTVLLGNDESLAQLKEAREKLKDHDLIIFGFNKTEQRAYKNFGIAPEDMAFITDWAAQQPMIAVYLGSPYALTKIPGHKNFTAYIVGYEANKSNNFAAAQVIFGGVPAKGVLPVTSATFAVGESVIIPDRYCEEYHHFVGSELDSLSQVSYSMNEKSALLTLVPQVAELVAGGKLKLSDTVGDLLETDDSNASLTVGQLLDGYKDAANAGYLKALLEKYRSYISIDEVTKQMLGKMGMRSTELIPAVSDGGIPQVTTTGYDYQKYLFTLGNGGKYAGDQVISVSAAELVLGVLQEAK